MADNAAGEVNLQNTTDVPDERSRISRLLQALDAAIDASVSPPQPQPQPTQTNINININSNAPVSISSALPNSMLRNSQTLEATRDSVIPPATAGAMLTLVRGQTDLKCSLTGRPCVEPVLASSSGLVFDKQEITPIIQATNTCPITGSRLVESDLIALTTGATSSEQQQQQQQPQAEAEQEGGDVLVQVDEVDGRTTSFYILSEIGTGVPAPENIVNNTDSLVFPMAANDSTVNLTMPLAAPEALAASTPSTANIEVSRSAAEAEAEDNDDKVRDAGFWPRFRRRTTRMCLFLPIVSIIQVIVLVIELSINYSNSGSIVANVPKVDPKLGPYDDALIQLGAKFTPCMRFAQEFNPGAGTLQCMLNTAPTAALSSMRDCDFNSLCGRFTGAYAPGDVPNQWLRFFLPIFLHTGIVHLLLNVLAQVSILAVLENTWGFFRVAVVYFLSGGFGFAFGAAYASPRVVAVGASGAIFALISCLFIDVFLNWRLIRRPWFNLFQLFFMALVGLLSGFIPRTDSASHVGGFFYGFLIGLVVMPAEQALRKSSPSSMLSRKTIAALYAARAVGLSLSVLFFYLVLRDFYDGAAKASQRCPWCVKLTCFDATGTNCVF